MKKNEASSVLQVLAIPVFFGLLLTLGLMAFCSFIILFGKMSSTQVSNLSLLCIGIGSFVASFLAANFAKQKRLLWGISAGICLFVCMVLISLAWFGQTVDFMRVLINLTVSVLSSLVGSFFGASMRHKKYKPNHKK